MVCMRRAWVVLGFIQLEEVVLSKELKTLGLNRENELKFDSIG
jgi:hypothetical protein